MSAWRILILLVAVGCATTDARSPIGGWAPSAQVFPGTHWASIALPETEGYSTPKLEMVRAFLEDVDTSAAIVILRGRVLFQYGNVERVSYVASVRKSVLAMLLGEHVARGEIRETATLAELGVDDVGGLTAEEKQATLGDLMTLALVSTIQRRIRAQT